MLSWSSSAHGIVSTQIPPLPHTENAKARDMWHAPMDDKLQSCNTKNWAGRKNWMLVPLGNLGIPAIHKVTLLHRLGDTCLLAHKHWLTCFLFNTQEMHSHSPKFLQHFAREHKHQAWSPSLPSPAETCGAGRERAQVPVSVQQDGDSSDCPVNQRHF